MTMTATRSTLPLMMPVEHTPHAAKPVTWRAIRAEVVEYRRVHEAAIAKLQAQFDVLAAAHAEALKHLAALSSELTAIKAKIVGPLPPDTAEFAKFVLGSDTGRRHFDAAGLLGAIAERQRPGPRREGA